MSIPSLHICGQVNTYEQQSSNKSTFKVRQVGFQETDIVNISKPITKFSYKISDPKEIRYILEKSYHLATSGRPGPVLIDIPMDLQRKKVNPSSLKSYKPKKIVDHKINEKIKSIIKELKKSDKPIIILPGRLTRWKGHSVLIEAIKKLGRKDIQCLIVGSDQDRENYRRELERQIENFGMQDIMHVVGHCNDMPAAYMLTDIVISASTDPEAFGRIMVEGQALGRLVIGSNHGGSTETVINGQTGWLVEPNDPDRLADKLNFALNLTEAQRDNITKTAIRHIQKNYSKQLMSSKTLEVYNELILGKTVQS